MKHEGKRLFEALSIENIVVQQISRDGEFHSRTAVKGKLTAHGAWLSCSILAVIVLFTNSFSETSSLFH